VYGTQTFQTRIWTRGTVLSRHANVIGESIHAATVGETSQEEVGIGRQPLMPHRRSPWLRSSVAVSYSSTTRVCIDLTTPTPDRQISLTVRPVWLDNERCLPLLTLSILFRVVAGAHKSENRTSYTGCVTKICLSDYRP